MITQTLRKQILKFTLASLFLTSSLKMTTFVIVERDLYV